MGNNNLHQRKKKMKIEIMREWNWMRLVCSDVIALFVGINLQGGKCLTAVADYK